MEYYCGYGNGGYQDLSFANIEVDHILAQMSDHAQEFLGADS